MIKKFINKYFVESVLVLGLVILCMVSYILANSLNKSMDDDMVYISNEVLPSKSIPVLKEEDTSYRRPYNDENIKIVKNYYDYQAEASEQERSIIYYENTYMPNTGVLYGAKEEFEVLVVADGTVEDVVADEVLGNVVTIKHTNNLITRYESLNEVNVMVGDTLKKGDVIGTSGENKIDSTYSNMLLFEVEHNGTYANPENIYGMNIKELS